MSKENQLNTQGNKKIKNIRLLHELEQYHKDVSIQGMNENTFQARLDDARCLNDFFEELTGEYFVFVDKPTKAFILYQDEHSGAKQALSVPMLKAYAVYLASTKPIYQNKKLVRLGASFSTIKRRIAFISWLHKQNNVPSPYTKEIVSYLDQLKVKMGIEGKHIHAKQAKKIEINDLKKAVNAVIEERNIKLSNLAKRQTSTEQRAAMRRKIILFALQKRAILLLGFVGLFRREELSLLRFEQLKWSRGDLFVKMNDQSNKGKKDYSKHLPSSDNPMYCPVLALRQYIKTANIKEGFLFGEVTAKGIKREKGLSGKTIARIYKKYTGISEISGHSFRVSAVQAMYLMNVPVKVISNNGGWKDESMVFHYLRDLEVSKGNKTLL